jgi:hypothetical protein
MAGTGITTSTFDDVVRSATAKTRALIAQKADLLKYVTVTHEPVKTYTYPFMSEPTISENGENQDVTDSDLTTSGIDITATSKEVSTYQSRLTNYTSVENYSDLLSEAFSKAMKKNINQDLFALGDQFTNTIGDSDTDITLDLIEEARYTLEANGADGPYYLAVTPHVKSDLISALQDSTSNAGYEGILAQYNITGELPPIGGMNILVINDLATGTSAGQKNAADIKCFAFNEQAIGINFAEDFHIAVQNIITKGNALYWLGMMSYGVAKLVNNYGVEVLVDNYDG